MNNLLKWIRIMGISIIVLGGIHLLATPLVLNNFIGWSRDTKLTFLFMYLAAGMGTLFPGIIVTYLIAGLKNKSSRSWVLCRISSIYLIVLGLLAVSTMPSNPFAYIVWILGILLYIPLQKIKVNYPTK